MSSTEFPELELLEQHLAKTARLTSRMTTILTRLDTRLVRLEKTVKPLGLAEIVSESRNIDHALKILAGEKQQPPPEITRTNWGNGEEEIIRQPPEYSNLEMYTSAIDRVQAEFERLQRNDLRSSEDARRDLQRLIEIGTRSLGALALKFVRDGCGQPIDVARLPELHGAAILPTFPLVSRIFRYLQKLPPRPQTLEEYAAIRGDYVAAAAATTNVEGAEDKCRLIKKAIDTFLSHSNAEQALLAELGLPSSLLTAITTHPFSLLHSLISTQITTIKRHITTQTFYAFELFELLQRYSLFDDLVATLRSTCLRSFPETLVDVKTARIPATSDIADPTYQVVSYLETLPRFSRTAESLLTSLGSGNWLMGAASKTPQLDSSNIIEHYVADLVAGLLENLEAHSHKQHIVGAIFMLNNLSHLRTHLIPSDVLGEAGEDLLNKSFREHRQRFMDCWQSLVATLDDSSRGGLIKQQGKETLGGFFARYDELETACKQHVLTRQDPTLRERLRGDVIALVVGALQAYVSRHQKNADKCGCPRPSTLGLNVAKHLSLQTSDILPPSSSHASHHYSDSCIIYLHAQSNQLLDTRHPHGDILRFGSSGQHVDVHGECRLCVTSGDCADELSKWGEDGGGDRLAVETVKQDVESAFRVFEEASLLWWSCLAKAGDFC